MTILDKSFASIAEKRQQAYCHRHHVPFFAPPGGYCPHCFENIYTATENDQKSPGYSVRRAGETLITSCPFCHWSFCE